MKESFIFYASFFEAICELDDKKRLKMYDSITNLALKNEEKSCNCYNLPIPDDIIRLLHDESGKAKNTGSNVH